MSPGLLLLAAFVGGALAALLITRVLQVRGPSVVRWGIHSTHGFTAHANAHERPVEPTPPTVTDELGTHYVAGWGARNGGGDDDYTEVTAEFLFAPDPPPGARVLTVTIPRSIAFASRVESREGPWVIATPLHP